MSLWSSHICKALQRINDYPPDSMPSYDEDAVHRTEELIKLIYQAVEDTDPSQNHRKIILNQYARRLKEGITLYNRARLKRIVDIRMKSRGMPSSEVRKMLTPLEIEFLDSYSKVLAQYSKETDIDITEPFHPPQGLNAEVIVLRDVGSIMAGDRFIFLKQNEILTLKTNVAQELEQKGFVKITEYLK